MVWKGHRRSPPFRRLRTTNPRSNRSIYGANWLSVRRLASFTVQPLVQKCAVQQALSQAFRGVVFVVSAQDSAHFFTIEPMVA